MSSYLQPAECLKQTIYQGTICIEELRRWQLCFSGQQRNDVFVSSSVDQDRAESLVGQLQAGLPLISPSPECLTAIKPFMCLYLFGSCDANNQLHKVSQTECVRLRDNICAGPWEIINRIQKLPDCSTFEDQQTQCLGNIQLDTAGSWPI